MLNRTEQKWKKRTYREIFGKKAYSKGGRKRETYRSKAECKGNYLLPDRRRGGTYAHSEEKKSGARIDSGAEQEGCCAETLYGHFGIKGCNRGTTLLPAIGAHHGNGWKGLRNRVTQCARVKTNLSSLNTGSPSVGATHAVERGGGGGVGKKRRKFRLGMHGLGPKK